MKTIQLKRDSFVQLVKRVTATAGAASLLLALGLGATGCRGLSVQGMVAAATQDLGIPVFFWALDEDACAARQLQQLFNQYGKWDPKNREVYASRLRKNYKAVIILATKNLGDTAGDLRVLRLLNSRRYEIASKTLVDTRRLNAAHGPGTIVDKGSAQNVEGKVLSMRPYFSKDRSHKAIYLTQDSEIFGAIPQAGESKPRPLSLEDALRARWIYPSSQKFVDNDPCGDLADVEELL